MNYEEKYWELREAVDRAWDEVYKNPTAENLQAYNIICGKFGAFCAQVLEKLMDENSDVLARLK